MQEKILKIKMNLILNVKGSVYCGINKYAGFCEFIIERGDYSFSCTVPFHTIKEQRTDDIVQEILRQYTEKILRFYINFH